MNEWHTKRETNGNYSKLNEWWWNQTHTQTNKPEINQPWTTTTMNDLPI